MLKDRENFREDGMEETKRVLVVDDEKGICSNVEKILSKGGYEVSHAVSAKEALDKMTGESFSLLLSDIVMPEMNGLELLKMVKDQWPLTKVVMMTAYASTDTAVKAIRLGALDYVPKPFTPSELRTAVDRAVSGELREAKTTAEEKKAIHLMDADMPFDREAVAKQTGEGYADMLGPSDMPVVEVPREEPPAYFCSVGEMVCDIYKKLGNTCKAGLKTKGCPQKKAKKKKASGKEKGGFDSRRMIGIDQPFDYREVVAVTGPEYVENLHQEGFAFIPYEKLRENVARLMEKEGEPTAREVRSFGEAVSGTVLVIDDEVAVNNNLRKILEKKGYAVDQAMTREDALEKISEKAYQLALLDLKIPNVKGLELLKALRDTHPETRVIIITGYASIETAVETARLGAVDYLSKPFTPDEVRSATHAALQAAA
jgi:DNA-binding response OmpR family regulator